MKSINILLVEDNEGDILLTKEAFEESRIVNEVIAIRDGRKAIDFFESINNREHIPNLILLDVNLPRMSGHEVLAYIKNNEKFKSIPVIMLTTSSAEKDILLSD